MTTTPKATQTHLTPNITVPSPAIVFIPPNGQSVVFSEPGCDL